MNSKGKRLKKTVLAIPPAAPATVAVVPVGAPPLGRPASECGVKNWVGNLGKGRNCVHWRNSQNREWLLLKLLTFNDGSTGSWE